MKKRILSIILATLLIAAMAIPTSAATYSNNGNYSSPTGTCSYHTYAHCTPSYWNALIEWIGSTDSYANYTFKTTVALWEDDGLGGFTTGGSYSGPAATRMSQCTRSGFSVYAIDAYYYINNSQVRAVNWLLSA